MSEKKTRRKTIKFEDINVEETIDSILEMAKNGDSEAVIYTKLSLGYTTFKRFLKEHNLQEELDFLQIAYYEQLLKNFAITKMPGSVAVPIFWLRNRARHLYTERTETNVSGSLSVNLNFKEVIAEEFTLDK